MLRGKLPPVGPFLHHRHYENHRKYTQYRSQNEYGRRPAAYVADSPLSQLYAGDLAVAYIKPFQKLEQEMLTTDGTSINIATTAPLLKSGTLPSISL